MPERSFLSGLTGSFAMPAKENPTIVMIEAAYRQLGLDARYINCEVRPDDLGDAVRGARAMGWVGFNCSLPHKVAVVRHLDELAPSARIIGAVNCVVNRNGRLVGENTDGQGFLASLREIVDPAGRSVVVMGAGGAARAVAVELGLARAATVVIVNRDQTRGQELVSLLNANTPARAELVAWAGTFRPPEGTDILVNATSVGLFPEGDACPDLDVESLRPGAVVADVIPNPPRTRLLRRAKQCGCVTLDGLGMLVNQGAIAIKLWTGGDPDKRTMREALRTVLDA